MRWLGLDIGTKLVGAAVGDDRDGLALPLRVLKRQGEARDLVAVAALCTEVEVQGLVLGLPLQLSGREGQAAARVRNLGQKISTTVGLPVCYWDERFSTVEAERVLINVEIKRHRRKDIIDSVAAAWILQGFLDSRQRERKCEPEVQGAEQTDDAATVSDKP